MILYKINPYNPIGLKAKVIMQCINEVGGFNFNLMVREGDTVRINAVLEEVVSKLAFLSDELTNNEIAVITEDKGGDVLVQTLPKSTIVEVPFSLHRYSKTLTVSVNHTEGNVRPTKNSFNYSINI